jgi:membrane associated rhomboid family serine protease
MRLPDSWSRARATMVVSLATAAAWTVAAILGAGEWATIWGGFIPARLAYGGDEMLAPFWLTPLTATLLHAGILHLAFNLLILVFCGRPVESVLGPIGFAILYLLGAYAAAGAQYWLDPLSPVPMVGASGAISAIVGAYAMLFGRNKVKIASHRLAVWLNALWLMVAWVALQLCMGIALAGRDFLFSGEGIQVAIGAHIGGFLVGVLLANPLLLFRYRRA